MTSRIEGMSEPVRGKAASPLLNLSKGYLSAGANDVYTRDGQYICLHLPPVTVRHQTRTRLLVVVHGYGAKSDNGAGRRSVRQLASFWGRRVTALNWMVMAPHFDETRFQNSYQRLGDGGIRADRRLNRLVDEAGMLLPTGEAEKPFLLGFSGGGQFAHRYAAFGGDRFARIVVGAPGWFLWPDPCLPYPLGMGDPDRPDKGAQRLDALCRSDMLVLVGENDRTQGAFRKRYNGVDLCALQGAGRRDRAANWFSALRQISKKEKIPLTGRLLILKHTAHRVTDQFVNTAVAYLMGIENIASWSREVHHA